MAGLDWAVPDYTTLGRRRKTLAVQVPYRRADGPLNRLVDSTGIKVLGDGEWQARRHGVQDRCQWRKGHLAMDTAASVIRAVAFTSSREGDSPGLPDLLNRIPEDEDIGTVTANGAYDTRRGHTAIIDRPGHRDHSDPQERSPPRKADCPAAETKPCVPPGTLAGHSGSAGRDTMPAARIEANMRCLKAFGERIAARHPDRQTAEIQIRIALMNRFSALGTAQIVRVV